MLKIGNHHYHASRPVEPVAVLLHKNDTSRPAIIFLSFAKMKAEKWLWKFDWLCPRWFFLDLKFLWFKKGKKRERKKMRVGKEKRKSSRAENGKSKIEKRKMENRNFKISDLNIFLRFFENQKRDFQKEKFQNRRNGNPVLKNSFCNFWKWDG